MTTYIVSDWTDMIQFYCDILTKFKQAKNQGDSYDYHLQNDVWNF